MRISRALALAGIDSRRKCETYVENGAVRVNGEVVRDLGRQVDIESDEIIFRGRALEFEKPVHYVLFKPVGYSTTVQDPHAKKTVFELLPKQLVAKTKKQSRQRVRVFPVGRLDRDSSGLLLFTNDGDLANRLTHPRYGVGKWYEVRLNRPLEHADRNRILKGIRLREGIAHVEDLQMLSKRVYRLLLKEGKNREVRRLFHKAGYEVLDLCRISFGPLTLGRLKPGQGYFLKSHEVSLLRSSH